MENNKPTQKITMEEKSLTSELSSNLKPIVNKIDLSQFPEDPADGDNTCIACQ